MGLLPMIFAEISCAKYLLVLVDQITNAVVLFAITHWWWGLILHVSDSRFELYVYKRLRR